MRLADNHAGYNVEYYHRINGWIPTTTLPYTTRPLAELALENVWPKEFEYRVYEAV